MIDRIIKSLESMADEMRARGDNEKASGVESALWLIEQSVKLEPLRKAYRMAENADHKTEPQTDVYEYHNGKWTKPQTERRE